MSSRSRRQGSSSPLTPRRSFEPGWDAGSEDLQLRSYQIGVLPLVNRLLERMRLRQILSEHLPADDRRMELSTVSVLLVLIRNVFASRQPVYGVAEWAVQFAPDLLELEPAEVAMLHDDRLGRALDRLFDGVGPELVLAVVRHVVREFQLNLDELHNDSTTISFYGVYEDAQQESQQRGRATCAVTWGHSKDHRPDLKQLLYILTITEDGGVPVYFTTASGNQADDRTHLDTWDLLHQLVGRPGFLYVADCKLASSENLRHIATRGGRFVTILPHSHKEDQVFRERLRQKPDAVVWRKLYEVSSEGELYDRLSVCSALWRRLSPALVSQHTQSPARVAQSQPPPGAGLPGSDRAASPPVRSADAFSAACQSGAGRGRAAERARHGRLAEGRNRRVRRGEFSANAARAADREHVLSQRDATGLSAVLAIE